MTPSNGPYGQPQHAQRRPHYVPFLAIQDINGTRSSTPTRLTQGLNSARQNNFASPSTPNELPAASVNHIYAHPSPAASRPFQISPSAYDRFDEVSWIVNLSSRIGNALRTPPQAPLKASSIPSPSSSPSSSQAHIRARNRVRLPRPSREFRDLQHKIQLSQASMSGSAAADMTPDVTSYGNIYSPESAIQWAQHAQRDFERRNADLEHSRQDIVKHLATDVQRTHAEQQSSEARTVKPLDPAVQRSMLAAKSLQELMRSGGLQSENGDGKQPDFADLLASAEPLPGATGLGPSSLFEANRSSDGTLDIESILQQRAKLAAFDEHNPAGPSQTKVSLLDLQHQAPKSTKRPVIEVLGAQDSNLSSTTSGKFGEDDEQHQLGPSQIASQSSDESSSKSSSESESSADSEDSHSDFDEAAPSCREGNTGSTAQARYHDPIAPHPMDQIAIVDGTFKIIPARSTQVFSHQQKSAQGHDDRQESSAEEDSDQEEHHVDDGEDEQMDIASDARDSDAESDAECDDDEEDEMDDSAEHTTPHSYHDGFGGTGIRNLLFEGPTGHADEPIVLSDSDDDDGSSDDRRNKEEQDDEEMDEDNEDELDDGSDGNGGEEDETRSQDEDEHSDVDFQTQQVRDLAQPRADLGNEAEDELAADDESEDEDNKSAQEAISQIHYNAFLNHHAENANVKGFDSQFSPQQHRTQTAASGTPAVAAQDVASSQLDGQKTLRSFVANEESDAMPESEVEPEELDEDLRWSDIEADQPVDQEPAYDQIHMPSDAALRAMHGSQSMPGFVTASQLFSNIQAAGAVAGSQEVPSTDDADQAAGPIDPQLLEGFVVDGQVSDMSQSIEATASMAVETQPSQPEPPTSQMEADIFDAFTRQDATLNELEPVIEDRLRSVSSSQPVSEEGRDDISARTETSDAAKASKAIQPDALVKQVGSATPESLPKQPEELHSDIKPDRTAHKAQGSPVLAEIEESSHETVNNHQPRDTIRDLTTGAARPSELNRPILARVESTDVLEADVEDNSEDEAESEEIVVESSSVPLPPTASALLSVGSESVAADADGISINLPNAEAPADQQNITDSYAVDELATIGVPQPHILVVVPEDEGILSGDLADRDSSIERQAAPLTSKSSDAAQENEIQAIVMGDAANGGRPAEPGSASAPNKPAQREEAEESLSQDKQLKQGKEKVDHAMDQIAHQKAKSEAEFVNRKIELQTFPKEQCKGPDMPVSAGPNSLLPNRVPPSPASSDRRSTSSFTPVANRQGNRHIHGAAKHSLFTQMTEAASSLASNLAAPLRAIPSLLPISESLADETTGEVDQEDEEAAATAEDDGKDNSRVRNQEQATRLSKASEEAKFTITTRSHCFWRLLQLNKVEGAPIFIVPGCSINYEDALREEAQDLGKTSEQKSTDWIDVDPDLLPPDVHHMLSRIIGLQMLNEGICVEPDSSAAKLLLSGYDLDGDLLTSFDNEGSHGAELLSAGSTAKLKSELSQANSKADSEDATKAKQPGTDAEIETYKMIYPEHSKTPSRQTTQTRRHERASSVASASSHHRSPRRSDPMSANADFLPDDERVSLRKERHPPAAASGDISIASLEDQVKEEEGEEKESAGLDGRILQKTEDSVLQGGLGDFETSASPASQPKKKRGRPTKSAAADPRYKPSDQEDKEADEDDAEGPVEPELKNGRGRKRVASSNNVSMEGQTGDAKDARDAAAVEDVLDAVASNPKRARHGCKSQDTATFDPRAEQASVENEEEDDRKTRITVRTRATRKGEREVEVQQQPDGEREEEGVSKLAKGGRVEQGRRGERKRKQAADELFSAAEASAPGKVPKVEGKGSAKPPRRSRRSQGGLPAQSISTSKTSPRKSPKRKVLKLN